VRPQPLIPGDIWNGLIVFQFLSAIGSPLPRHGKAVPVVSDFFDFSVYIDADVSVLRDRYVQRFLTFRDTAFHDPRSYFHRYSLLSDDEAIAPQRRSGSAPISPISRKTCCRRGRARR
jgi:hypothetical protein